MKVLIPTKIARYVYAAVIALFGMFHFMNTEGMAGMTPFGGTTVVYITGVAFLLAAISFFIGKQVRLAGYLLAVLLLLTAFLVHMMGMMGVAESMPDATAEAIDMAKGTYMSQMIKDIAMSMGAIAFANAADS